MYTYQARAECDGQVGKELGYCARGTVFEPSTVPIFFSFFFFLFAFLQYFFFLFFLKILIQNHKQIFEASEKVRWGNLEDLEKCVCLRGSHQ